MTIKQALNRILKNDVGSTSSIETLIDRVEKMIGYRPAYGTIVSYRRTWRDQNNRQDDDCRTYRTQFRRDQQNDDHLDGEALSELETLTNEGVDLDDLMDLVIRFHSIQHFQRHCVAIQAYRQAA